MKITKFHLWVYKIWYHFWEPIFKTRPDLVQLFIDNLQGWQQQEKFKSEFIANECRKSFHIVKNEKDE